MNLKPRVLALAVAVSALAGSGLATAQDFTFGWSPRTGDVWVDTWLSDINRYGRRYREPFINDMVGHYGVQRSLVSELLLQRNWAPGDVYYACAIAQVLGWPCRRVVDEWQRSHGQGWGVVAQRLGIKPGSAAFHRLKRGFVPTYDRWGRSIVIDTDLYDDFPRRARAAKAHHTTRHSGSPAHAGGSHKGKQHGPPSGKGKGKHKRGKGPGRH